MSRLRALHDFAGAWTGGITDLQNRIRPADIFDSLKLSSSLAEQSQLHSKLSGLDKYASAFQRADSLGLGSFADAVRGANIGTMPAVTQELRAFRSLDWLGHSSRMFELQATLKNHFGLTGLDDFHKTVTSIVGDSAVLASIDSYRRLTEPIGKAFGASAASLWDIQAVASLLPNLASFHGQRSGGLFSVIGQHDGAALAAFTWRRRGRSKPLSVAALGPAKKTDAPSDRPRIRVAAGSSVRCRFCFTEMVDAESEFELLSDEEIRFRVLAPSFCLKCLELAQEDPTYPDRCLASLKDNPRPILHLVRGNGKNSESPGVGTRRLYLIVDNTKNKHCR